MKHLVEVFREDPKRLEESFCFGRYYLCTEKKQGYCTLLRMRKSKPRKNRPDVLYVASDKIILGDILYLPHTVAPAINVQGTTPAARKFDVEVIRSIFSKEEFESFSEEKKKKKIKKFLRRGAL